MIKMSAHIPLMFFRSAVDHGSDRACRFFIIHVHFLSNKKTGYPCISTQIARHGCYSCPCRSLTYCFSVSQLRHKTETTEEVIERTSHTNLSYPVIPRRATDTKLPAAVRHGNNTVFLFLSEFFKPLVINFF